MSRMTRTLTGACFSVSFLAIVAAGAHGQQPAGKAPVPPRVDCSRLNATVDHATMDHAAHEATMKACAAQGPETAPSTPTMPGQAAFGAIGEIVRMLENDPATDWSKVNIEALRQHLIDMDEVTLHSRVVQRSVRGGMAADVTGPAATAAAIRRMIPTHAKMFDASSEFDARTQRIPSGVRLTVTARDPADTALVARIRGLGFIGFLTEGDHHPRHHLAMARGDAEAHAH